MLNQQKILHAMEAGVIVIDPFNPAQLQPNSYDVRLGNWFIEVHAKQGEPDYGKLIYAPDGAEIYIDCRTTTLAMTKESIGTRSQLVPMLENKSTTRRRGIEIVGDAGVGDIGYHFQWTVELLCTLDGPIKMVVNEPFGQVLFEQTDAEWEDCEDEVRYHGQYFAPQYPLAMIPLRYRARYADFYRRCAWIVAHSPSEVTRVFHLNST